MSGKKRYIAVYLIGIFSYPLLFQPWHIVHHHGHDHSEYICESNHCHKEKKSECTISITNHDHCYICDFKFSPNNLPIFCGLGFISHQFNELQLLLIISPDLTRGYSRVNPRAPPEVS